MKTQDFTTSFTVDQSPQQVFDATLRANIGETIHLVVITEQGENRKSM